MRAFLYPHTLLAGQAAYVAALHRDNRLARHALRDWLSICDPESLKFAEHKLIGTSVDRFPDLLSGSPKGGVFANVARQARLRAHYAERSLNTLFQVPPLSDFEFIAVGETHERLVLADGMQSQMEALEFAVNDRQLERILQSLKAVGFTPAFPPRRAWGRRARLAFLTSSASTLGIRLLSLEDPPHSETGVGGIGRMSADAHARFMRSRLVSLLGRRDQVLFDIWHLRHDGSSTLDLIRRLVPPYFRRTAAAVLG